MSFLRLLYMSSGISIFICLPKLHVKANSKAKFLFCLFYISKNPTLKKKKKSKINVIKEVTVPHQSHH